MNSAESINEYLLKWRVETSKLETNLSRKEEIQKEVGALEKNIENWTEAKKLLEILKTQKQEARQDFILGIINSALRDIFQEDYRIEIRPKDMSGKSVSSTQKYDIIFFQNGIEIARNENLLKSNGGGVLSIASLFFKILIGYLYSNNKFYIFDEALSQVSPQYRERLSLFLRKFCETYSFTLVIVSQTEELEEHAHIVYEVEATRDENDIPTLAIKNTHGELPEQDYFYTDIENFQSIKKLRFLYKGFTIIRGPNNSGKSATLRAIESIIFNNFNSSLYPRIVPSGVKRKPTKITFGYMGDGNKKEIGLIWKSGKVQYIIDGESYYGKNLAAEKLKEKVEEIGFRYVDFKQMYKNFKGDLKEQTERIAYTSQHDGLFLVGSKVSESEKIFSFLFNTENIALAIAKAKEELLQMGNTHKTLQEELLSIEEEIALSEQKINLYTKKYYAGLINYFLRIKEEPKNLKTKLETMEQLLDKISKYLKTADNLNGIQKSLSTFARIKTDIEDISSKINTIEKILNKTTWLKKLFDYEGYKLGVERIKKSAEIVENLIPFYNWLIIIKKLEIHKKQLDHLIIEKSKIDKEINELDKKYNIMICETCLGKGMVPLT